MNTVETITMNMGGEHDIEFTYPALFTLEEFVAKYGMQDVLIMVQQREYQLYEDKIDTEWVKVQNEPDAQENLQAVLDAFQPLQDREPTELELMVTKLLDSPSAVQAEFQRMCVEGVQERQLQAQEERVEDALTEQEEIDKEYAMPENVSEPVETHQTEPVLESFEDIGRIAAETDSGADAELNMDDNPDIDGVGD